MRSLLLLAIFFIDLRVHANAKDCWGHSVPCAIRSEARVRHLKSDTLEISLDKASLLEQTTKTSVRLVSGLFYLRAMKGTVLKTPFAQFNCLHDCQALVDRQTDRVTLKVLEGRVFVKRLGEDKFYAVDAGLQVSVSEVTDSGIAEMEFPQSLPWMTTAKDWARLYAGDKKMFHHELTEFRARWNEAVESASEVHKTIADRQIASHNAELAKQKARAEASAKEDQRLRQLFRSKNNFD